jgi:hypothetical protein
MADKRRFPLDVLKVVEKSKILGLRAGTKPHRFIGIWCVVVDGRVFVRSWELSDCGWYRTLLEEPVGTIQIADGREIPVRAIRTRSERIMDAVSTAYLEKYNTPGALKYSRGFAKPKHRATTTELAPA